VLDRRQLGDRRRQSDDLPPFLGAELAERTELLPTVGSRLV
jgi:hypothetical protein